MSKALPPPRLTLAPFFLFSLYLSLFFSFFSLCLSYYIIIFIVYWVLTQSVSLDEWRQMNGPPIYPPGGAIQSHDTAEGRTSAIHPLLYCFHGFYILRFFLDSLGCGAQV